MMNPNASSKAKRKRKQKMPNSKPQLVSLPHSSEESLTPDSLNMSSDTSNTTPNMLNMSSEGTSAENQSQSQDLPISGIEDLEEDAEVKLTGKHLKQQKKLQNMFAGVGGAFVVAGDVPDAKVILSHAESFSTNLARLGQENETVYKVIEYCTETSVWLTVLGEFAVILVQMAANHGVDVQSVFKRPQKQVA